MANVIDRGREAFRRQAWGDANAQLSAADQETPLEPQDLERLAVAAYLVGNDSFEVWARAYQEWLQRGDAPRAARSAFWLGLGLALQGEMARSGGWLARARRVLDEEQMDCAERGFLLVPVVLQRMEEGDAAAAYATTEQICEIADRFGATSSRRGRPRARSRAQ